ncbi:MAG: POTRA domain-containing protein [Vicinamibacterales bacterium]
MGVLAAWPAAADEVEALLGRRLIDVRLVAAGAPVTDPGLLVLVETTVGEPLAMADVRQTIDHLVALGRFADIRVTGRADGDGVHLRYALVPLDRIVRVRFSGAGAIDDDVLRTEIDEQLGALPPASRRGDLAQLVEARYRARGYATPRVEVSLTPAGRPGEVVATVAVAPGPRTVIGRVDIEGDGPADLASRLGVAAGRPLDREALDARVRAVEDSLRDDRYYEAVVTATVRDAGPAEADVAVRVSLGDRVRVEFTGDSLPAARRRTLVPIEQARSVEEEVIEDASRNIEQYLRLEGYRQASAPATRRRADGELVITFAVRRGPLHVLESMTIEGGQPPAEALALLKLPPGEPFVEAQVATVAAALAELYRVRGFAAVQVTPRVTSQPQRDGRVPVVVRLELVEGPRTTVTAVAFEGVTAVPIAELEAALGLTAGKPFYRPQQSLDRATVERRYRNLGYQQAVVNVRERLSEDGTGMALTYAVREGPQTRVDHILITGTDRISPDLVRRELTLRPGTPLGYDALLESQQRLSALGLFRRVRITEVPHGTEAVNRDVLVEVEEAPSTAVSYGGGFEMGQQSRTGDDGGVTDRVYAAPRGFFEVTRRNLWGKNRSISLLTSASLRPTDPGIEDGEQGQGGYGLNQYRVVGTFREPRAFGTPGDAQTSAFLERGIRASFNFDRRGVRAEYARRLPGRIVLLGRYAYDYTELFATKIATEDQLLVDRLFPQVRLSTVFGSVIRDSRDDILDPQRGSVLGGELDIGLPALGSEVGFTKGFAQAFTYRRLPGAHPFVLAAGARLGVARGFETRVPRVAADGQPVVDEGGQPIVDVVTDLPASERFFAGGDTTVRGFALDRLGTEATLNADGFPTGGNAMLVLNAEIRTPHVKGLGLVGFLDAGNVFLRAGDLNLGELRAAAGFGLRYRSPLGPLRLDIGFKLDRRDFNRGTERRAVYHLSLGQAF